MIRCLVQSIGFFLVILTVACRPSDSESVDLKSKTTRIPVSSSSIHTARTKAIHPSFRYPAVIEAIKFAKTRAEISAVIEKIHFSPGQMVEKGDLLIEFQTDDFIDAVSATKAGLKSAQASAIQSTATWKRAQELMPDNFISHQDYDIAKGRSERADAAVLVAKANVQKAETELGRTKLFAPFNGKISRANYAEGEYVNSQAPTQPEPLFELVQLDPIYAKANVELGIYTHAMLLRGKMASDGIEVPGLVVYLELPGQQKYPLTGTFVSWDNISSPTVGTIAGRVQFDNPNDLLLPGSPVAINGETVTEIERIVIPQKAVMLDQQGHYVRIIDAADTVQRRNIEVGIRVGADWAVSSGLLDGDRIIVEGAQSFRDGAEVEVQP